MILYSIPLSQWRRLALWPGRSAWLLLALPLTACQPTVKVEAPQEPITINLNIKLDAEVRLKIEETAGEDIEENEDIF